MTNQVRILHNVYLVRTHNAFKQALYDCVGAPEGTKKAVRDSLTWHPIFYPAIVSFTDLRESGRGIEMGSLHIPKWAYGIACMVFKWLIRRNRGVR